MTPELSKLVLIRDGISDDHNFVMATFLRGLYYGDSWFSKMHKSIFMDNYKGVAEAIVLSPKNTIKVAVLREDPDVILGYSILSNDFSKVHWVYVKAAWRLQGVAKAITPPMPSIVTHLTPLGESLLSKINNPTFNPFVVP